MDFGFEDGVEAGFAEFLVVLWAEDGGAGGFAEGAEGGGHLGLCLILQYRKSGFGGGDFDLGGVDSGSGPL